MDFTFPLARNKNISHHSRLNPVHYDILELLTSFLDNRTDTSTSTAKMAAAEKSHIANVPVGLNLDDLTFGQLKTRISGDRQCITDLEMKNVAQSKLIADYETRICQLDMQRRAFRTSYQRQIRDLKDIRGAIQTVEEEHTRQYQDLRQKVEDAIHQVEDVPDLMSSLLDEIVGHEHVLNNTKTSVESAYLPEVVTMQDMGENSAVPSHEQHKVAMRTNENGLHVGHDVPNSQLHDDHINISDVHSVAAFLDLAMADEEPSLDEIQPTAAVRSPRAAIKSQKTADTITFERIDRRLHDTTWSLQEVMAPFLFDLPIAPIIPHMLREHSRLDKAMTKNLQLPSRYPERRSPFFVPQNGSRPKSERHQHDQPAVFVCSELYLHAPELGQHGYITLPNKKSHGQYHGRILPVLKFAHVSSHYTYIGHYEITCIKLCATLLDQERKVQYPRIKFRKLIDKGDLLRNKLGLEFRQSVNQKKITRMNLALKYCKDDTGNVADMTVILLRLVHFDERQAQAFTRPNLPQAQLQQSHHLEVSAQPTQDTDPREPTSTATADQIIIDLDSGGSEDISLQVKRESGAVAGILGNECYSRKRGASSPVKPGQSSFSDLLDDHHEWRKRLKYGDDQDF